MKLKDTYTTVNNKTEAVIFKDKNSKFFGYAYPIFNEDDVKLHINELKKEHHAARHWCYAYQLGVKSVKYRANDDGEPNNSAGMPIYGQIQSFDITNVLVVVVRYFGGVKLGVGGLINAYKTSAKMALETAHIIEKTIDVKFQLKFDYQYLSKVMRILDQQDVNIYNQKLELDCLLDIAVRKSKSEAVFTIFEALHHIKITKL